MLNWWGDCWHDTCFEKYYYNYKMKPIKKVKKQPTPFVRLFIDKDIDPWRSGYLEGFQDAVHFKSTDFKKIINKLCKGK